jgi:hypothetical protein
LRARSPQPRQPIVFGQTCWLPHARAALSISYMPIGLVPELTVEENILVPVDQQTLVKTERLALVTACCPAGGAKGAHCCRAASEAGGAGACAGRGHAAAAAGRAV